MKDKKNALKINKRLLCCIIAAAVGVLCLILVYKAMRAWEIGKSQAITPTPAADGTGNDEDDSRAMIYKDGIWYALREDLETTLILGLDSFEAEAEEENSYRNTQQSDFLLLLIVDNSAETCTALQLNRDTMTEIQILGLGGAAAGTFTGQLALAHTYGSGGNDSCRNAVKAVSNLLYGIEIDHYISLTMDAVSIINDMVGGVTVTITDDFSNIDPTLIQGEEVTLMGEQALTYVRARQALENNTNVYRMERQRQYLDALYRKLGDCAEADSGFVLDSLLSVSQYMVSDCTLNQLSSLYESTQSYDFAGVQALEGESVVGEEYMEFYVDEEALQSLILDLFYEAQPDAP